MVAGHTTRAILVVGGIFLLWATPAFAKSQPGSVLRTLWELHPKVIIGTVAALLVQSVLIAALLFHSRRRWLAEDKLRLSEARYRGVVESQREMVCRYLEDTTLTFVNDAYCRYFGKNRGELIGVPFLSLIPESSHPTVHATIDQAIRNRTTVSQEHEILLPDGSTGWMFWEDHAIFDDSGNLQEMQGAGRDITKRKLAEEAHRQAEVRFTGVFRGSPTGICIIRQADGCILDVNPSWETLFGITRSEAVGRDPVALGLFENSGADQRFKAFLTEGRPLHGLEQKAVTPAGIHRWMSISTDLTVLAGEPCFIVMSKDITDRREVEETRENLAHASRLALLGELTASIAHEVNQPLGAILSNAETAEMLLELDEIPLREVRHILADIRRDDIRASETIKRVRGLVAGRQGEAISLELNEILSSVTRLVAHDLTRRAMLVTMDLLPGLPGVSGDRGQIEQVFLNLILNAMDASEATPAARRRLRLATRLVDDGWVEASVCDNGHGIPPETLPRVFDSFFSSKEHGMGLGLALSRSIVERHGGRISAENNTSGGATFRLWLPVYNKASRHEHD